VTDEETCGRDQSKSILGVFHIWGYYYNFPTYFSTKITYILRDDLHKHIPHCDWPS